MNMQAMLRQAQNLQKDMLNAKKKVDETEFTSESSLVTVKMMGTRKLTSVKIKKDDNFQLEDLDMLEDMLIVAINDVNEKIDKALEDSVGKYTKGMPGLF